MGHVQRLGLAPLRITEMQEYRLSKRKTESEIPIAPLCAYARWLAPSSAVRFERNEQSHNQQASFEQDEHPGVRARGGLAVLACEQHSNQAQKQEKPTGKRYEHRPVLYPDVVSANYRQARDEHQNAREVNDWWNLRVVEMWLHKRELGDKHGDHGGAEKRCNLL
jgi:hypothetical protein